MTVAPSRTVTIEEAARELGISKWLAYDQARNGSIGGIPVFRIGRKIVIPRAALERVLNGQSPVGNLEGDAA